jgi:hypothetical protein
MEERSVGSMEAWASNISEFMARIRRFMANVVIFDSVGGWPTIRPLTEDKKQLDGSCAGSAAHREAEQAVQLASSHGKDALVSVGDKRGLLPHNIDW